MDFQPTTCHGHQSTPSNNIPSCDIQLQLALERADTLECCEPKL